MDRNIGNSKYQPVNLQVQGMYQPHLVGICLNGNGELLPHIHTVKVICQ